MGKMPVVGLIGLVWAGIALTGCECCRNCRQGKFTPSPTFPTRNSSVNNNANPTPAMIGDARPAAESTTITPAKGPDPSGTMGFATSGQSANDTSTEESGVTPAVSTSGSRGVPSITSPTKADSLRPVDDRLGGTTSSLPPREIDRGRAPSLGSGSGTMGEVSGTHMLPPRPVIPASATSVGDSCPGGVCPSGGCPSGKCPSGTCPGGKCPTNDYRSTAPTTLPPIEPTSALPSTAPPPPPGALPSSDDFGRK